MQKFEITVDGQAQPGDYATQQEAEAKAATLRQGGKNVVVRPKEDRVEGQTAQPAQGTQNPHR